MMLRTLLASLTLTASACSTTPPLLPEQASVLRERNSDIRSILRENIEGDKQSGHSVRLFVASDNDLKTFVGTDKKSTDKQAEIEIDPITLRQSACIYYWINSPVIQPLELPCEISQTDQERDREIASNRLRIQSLRRDYNDLTEAFVGAVEIALLNNEEIVKIRQELHEIGELISERDVAVGDYKDTNDQFIADMKSRLDNLESLIRAGIPQYE